MNVLIAVLYGFIVWLSCVAYALIVGGPAGLVLALAPVMVSGVATALLALDFACALVWRLARPRRDDNIEA